MYVLNCFEINYSLEQTGHSVYTSDLMHRMRGNLVQCAVVDLD